MFNNMALQLEETSYLLLLPLLVCCMLPMIMRMFRKPSPSTGAITEVDTWFTSYGINEAFDMVKGHISSWRSQKESEPASKSKFSLFGSKPPPERFVASESIPPRLLKFSDPVEGDLTFEFTETEAGGTAIRVNYYPHLKDRVQKMRASFPLKVPFVAGTPCATCGKTVLPEFNICPFCGQRIK